MNIKYIRKIIDSIDEQIFELLEKRNELVDIISEYKEKNNLPIFDAVREKEKFINSSRDKITILKVIMAISKIRQFEALHNNKTTLDISSNFTVKKEDIISFIIEVDIFDIVLSKIEWLKDKYEVTLYSNDKIKLEKFGQFISIRYK